MTSPASTTATQPLSPTGSPVLGRFLWHELLASSADAAVAFYPPVTGWTVQTMASPSGDPAYTMFAVGEVPQCGVHVFPPSDVADGARAQWLPYMGTPDVNGTAREAVSLGARELMPPTDIPGVGRIAVLRDPEGAQFALYAPAAAPHAETRPAAGEFAWHEMMCDDPDAAFAFYARLFGWTKKHAMDMGADGIYQMYGLGEHTYGGFGRRAPTSPPSMWNCYIRVADLDAACAAVRRLGGEILMGPHPVPNDDRIAVCRDDQGALVSLVGATRR